MRHSKQRELILKIVRENRIHCTADDVYQLARQEDSTISLGTVYRNLNLLTEQGFLKKLAMPDGGDRYDGGMHEHHHCVCSECGKVCDVLYPLPGLPEAVEEQTGMLCRGYQMTVLGICETCREKAAVPKETAANAF